LLVLPLSLTVSRVTSYKVEDSFCFRVLIGVWNFRDTFKKEKKNTI